MEPMVIFGAGLVIYCGYIAVVDAVSDLQRGKAIVAKEAVEKRRVRAVGRRLIFSASRRAGGADARWRGPLTGSV
ncbi:MAG TPA: hypothetical protein VMJ66_14175 [Geobacteraceae bacterium]|nr:hypothetical protein [Geobacteraceae bacterium]